MDLSIIIVNHNNLELTQKAILSVLKTVKKISYEILVIDNSDICCSHLDVDDDRVKLFCGFDNKGFGNACNIGVSYSSGEFLLFLNSDSIVLKNTIDSAFEYMVGSVGIGALGVRQLLENGKLDKGCKRGFPTPANSLYYFLKLDRIFPNSRRFGSYRQTFVDERSVAKVDCISGAFMLIKKSVFKAVGGFDEEYFMYGEDVDLCYRLFKNGFFNLYYGKVSFIHLKGRSSGNRRFVLDEFYKSMEIYYDKHCKGDYGRLVNFMVKFGIGVKYMLAKLFR